MLIVQDPSTIAAIQSQVTLLVRAMYSNPPAHGARIVQTVLHDPALYQEISLVDTIFCSVYRNCTSALAHWAKIVKKNLFREHTLDQNNILFTFSYINQRFTF